MAFLDVDIANLRRREKNGEVERGRGYGGREEGEVSRVRRLEAGCRARRGTPCYKPILGVRSERGLGCRETVRRSVRGRWVVP